MTTIGAAIPSIPPRGSMLRRALGSCTRQHRMPDAISVVLDVNGQGAAATRNAAWQALRTDYVAFLDDDDEWLPNHLDALLAVALETDADMVFPWFEIVGGSDPFPQHFGLPWDPAVPRQTTITCLWKRSALEQIGGFPQPGEELDLDGHRVGEDFSAVLALNEAGGKIVHLPERSWIWHHHFLNTSGRADRWSRGAA